MVDFRKRLAQKDVPNPIDPVAIYETLDRASDKGPLRPAQTAILREWHETRRAERDIVLKLHTGQGKTLIGLLTLQSRLNELGAPVLYLCPNNHLIDQTCAQARQFGIPYCTVGDELPPDFLDGKAILIASVQKLFNGLTKFGIGQQSISAAAILLDDAHACVDAIRSSLLIRIPSDESPYTELRDLFDAALQEQGAGTYADIRNKDHDALLPVPYWEWNDKLTEVVSILAKHTDSRSIRFVWSLLKDRLAECQCVVSGGALEIAPYLPPLHLFGSYHKARYRMFMSATVTDDSFFVKGLGLSPATIRNPLVYKDERWSGEKMVLIPSIIDDRLDRATVVATFAKPKPERAFGVVALVPSFNRTQDWKAYGTTVATKETIVAEVARLAKGDGERSLVIANRYDGIDLPDKTCRVLILDSKPYAENLIDRYAESCRAGSEVTAIRTARTIEQGLGRSVRGEKDYCAIVMTGADLIRSVRTKDARKHLSNQTNKQIELGIDIARMAREEIENGVEPIKAVIGLINQCLRRDADWKAFYIEQMDAVTPGVTGGEVLDTFEREFAAEKKFQDGDVESAVLTLQGIIDNQVTEDADRGWYLQEIARYKYAQDKVESNKLQIAAHRKNRFLMKPRSGMQVSKISVVNHKRIENIIAWVTAFESYQELSVALEAVLSDLSFGVKADRFEGAFTELARALGFDGQRPDKEWKEGPDCLWALRDDEYLLVECKNEVELTRSEINKYESEQMNSSCAWFRRYYGSAKVAKVMIIPTRRLSNAAALLDQDVMIMDKHSLERLTTNVRRFFSEFRTMDFRDLSVTKVQQSVDAHHLSTDAIKTEYAKSFKPWRSK